MQRLLLSAIVLALAIAGVLTPARSIASAVCSIAYFPSARDSTITVFIGRATADTVLAGPGSMRYVVEGGHWSANRQDRPVHGQRMLVERIAGASAAELATVFSQRADSSVIVVPWDYDPGCVPAVWGRSFVWVLPESVGVFTVRLRPRDQWQGPPTFDALRAALEPYPHGLYYRAGYRGTDAARRGEGLTVAEFFDFYLALPTVRRYGPDSLRYKETLCDWAAAHPRQASRFPVSRLLQYEPCT